MFFNYIDNMITFESFSLSNLFNTFLLGYYLLLIYILLQL
jgi:hypothetical protein